MRERGFLARTLRLDAAPAPDWLKARRADGMVSIGTLSVGDAKVHLEQARLLWDTTLVRFVGIDARVDQAAAAAGDLRNRYARQHAPLPFRWKGSGPAV